MIKQYGKDKPYQGREDHLCKAIARYCSNLNIAFAHVANERKTNVVRGKLLKDMGVQAGFPDYMIFGSNGNASFFEVKVKKGRLRDNQKIWLNKLQNLGYKVGVIWSVDGLLQFLEELNQHD